jgi:hypothetical protein
VQQRHTVSILHSGAAVADAGQLAALFMMPQLMPLKLNTDAIFQD